ncbi:hypothetical protein D3C81_1485390 [compost metagenome]
MRDHRRDAPALGPEQAANDGFDDQANETQQLQGVLPDSVHRTADAGQQLHGDADFRFLDRYAEIGQRAVDGLQQRTIGVGECAIRMFGGAAEALGTEQLDQQRGTSRVESAETIEVDGGVGVVLAVELFAQQLQVSVMGKRPVARHPQPCRGKRSVQLGIAGRRAADHKLRACSVISQHYLIART